MFSWVRRWEAENNLDDDIVVDAEFARSEVERYNQNFTKEQDKYRDNLCSQIICGARNGNRVVYTHTVGDKKFMTNDYLEELKIFFEDRGFEVVKVYDDTFYGYYLQIMW